MKGKKINKKKAPVVHITIDNSLEKYKGQALPQEKTDMANEMLKNTTGLPFLLKKRS